MVLSVNYEEIENGKYNGVELHDLKNSKVYSFASNNFCKDYFNAIRFYIKNFSDDNHLVLSSSCDHFFMDMKSMNVYKDILYVPVALHIIDDVPIIKLSEYYGDDESIFDFYLDCNDFKCYENIMKEFIENGGSLVNKLSRENPILPSWDEVKETYVNEDYEIINNK